VVAARRPIASAWMPIEGCKRRGRTPRGDESSPESGGGRKAGQSHVCPSAEATFVPPRRRRHDSPRRHGSAPLSRGRVSNGRATRITITITQPSVYPRSARIGDRASRISRDPRRNRARRARATSRSFRHLSVIRQ
jgi:hypothetical protein